MDPNPGDHGYRVLVVGAGPAGLAAAERLAQAGVSVVVCDRMPSVARKFLMAGRGGLNLTHSEPLDSFLDRYGPARERLEPAIRAFPPDALRDWCEALGVETFTGSSGRIFPRAMKASPLLRAWLRRLDDLGVQFRGRRTWTGWAGGGQLTFATPDGEELLSCDAAVFALGGASWPRLGSDGAWTQSFRERGVRVTSLEPANGGFLIPWSDVFRTRFAGQPVKPLRISFDGAATRGEAMITSYGIEGGAIYALSAQLRQAVRAQGFADVELDLAPQSNEPDIVRRLAASTGQSISNRLRRAGLSPVAAGLLRESAGGPGLASDADTLAAQIKRCRIRLTGCASIERAISTAGGIAWDDVRADYSLAADPATFVCGEMLDWEAPTGGYLLQACLATGRAAAEGVLRRRDARPAQ